MMLTLSLTVGYTFADAIYPNELEVIIEYYQQMIDNPEFVNEMAQLNEKEMEMQLILISELEKKQNEKIALQQRYLRLSYTVITMLVLALIMILIETYIKQKMQKKLYQLTITDALTNIANRAHIINLFKDSLEKDNVVALLDIDDFKRVNDNYGHVVGDEVLRHIAAVLKESIRERDHVGRYGGEEFLVIFGNTDLEEARKILERMRKNVENIEWEHEGLKTTISIGVSVCSSNQPDEVLNKVDGLMYQAKRAGKNQIAY